MKKELNIISKQTRNRNGNVENITYKKSENLQNLKIIPKSMGQCTTKTKKRATQKMDQYWRQPDGTEKLASTVLPKLEFQGTLANFKIVNCQYTAISVKVEIKGVDTFLLRAKKLKPDRSANWAFQHKFQFEMTEYQLRKSFVEIYIIDQNEQIVGESKVNLFLISSGPYHQNFSINLKKGPTARIHFDLKISQVIEIELNSIEAEIDLFTKHPGQKFNYSIKTIVGHHTPLNVSQASYPVKVKLDNKENLGETPADGKARRMSQKSTEKLIPEGRNLVWRRNDGSPMPSIVMKTLVCELHHCYFQLLFWRIFQKNRNNEVEQTSQLFAECFVALHKIFDIEPTSVQSQGSIQQTREFSSTDKLWHNGQQIGKGLFKFQVTSDKYIKQMQIMVRTEEGIVKHSPAIFSRSQKSNKSTCPELVELIKIQEEIELAAVKLDRIQTQGSTDYPSVESRKLKISIEELLERLLTLLEKSAKTNTIIYAYSSNEELMKAQQLFLNFGFKTIGYLEEEDAHINDLCWQILIALIARGEFTLAHIGFDQREKDCIAQSKADKKLERKIDIALTYYQFMSKYLRIAVDSLSVKGLELERNFASLFCAYAYFRIHNFRNAILQAITRQNDPDLPEWRGIQFSLQEDIDYDELKQEVNTFTALFDWSNNFHKCLEGYEKYQAASNDIHEVLMREDWKYRLSKRGITFFQFVQCWVQYVEGIVVNAKDIQWKYFPGYSKILKCFLSEMKKRPILEYPDILKSSLFKLLANEKLLNPIVIILFNKANIHEPLTVIRAILLISEILALLCQKKKKMPATFNYFIFYQGIKIIMESQFSFAISKTIIMLYNYFKMFDLEFRRNISMFLLGKVFFKLFLHWSHNVRHVFYHLVMRLYHQSLKIDHDEVNGRTFQEEVNQEVRTRYLKLMEILEEARIAKREEKKVQYFKNIQKDLHKRLRRNLDAKKRKLRKNESRDTEGTILCPDSPASQKIVDPKIMFQQKFSLYDPMKKPQISRSQSQIVKPTIKIAYKMPGIQKQQQIKVLNKKNGGNFRHKIYDNTKGQKIEMKSSLNDHGKYNENDFQIAKIESGPMEYLEEAMFHFKSTNELFTKNFNNKNWELPKIQMEMPLDSREIRPQKIDNW